ncbi:MAG: O-phosphoseryl-tRNA(Sec) kinase [Methanothermococcus sp.]|jgi:O-phosphoseryl-tRNA(Sec) kinase|uniref:L-seryl-tRNA(Sec) kinase n=1 Tax=Methanothermococcus TaxID=155862 RepID=UPI00037715C2|nr:MULTISPECIES: L-seryl-tRNA(Sec) kinase [Methanothermococcus]MDK2789695.1 O-phosphoseryl-tRNA(Sec) kinase [Methanothermococcus sp.]MDK2988423.1 O-phosphoseryl-tRNA(Sec) kinase [Methanothermococcus sp.]
MLIILVGLPSVGKSTFSKILSKKLAEKGIDNIILGTDLIRESFPVWNEKYEDFIKDSTYYLIDQALKKYVVIVDDTNYYNSKRRDLINLAKDDSHFMIYLHAPLEVLIKRNIERGQKIPNEVITNMFNKFDLPGSKYKWDKPDITIDTTKKIDYDGIVDRIIQEIKEGKKERKHEKYNDKEKDKEKENEKDLINNVDRITRNIVGNFIKNNNTLDNKQIKKVLELRKTFLKEFKHKLKDGESRTNTDNIENEFKDFLKNNLK